MSASKKQELSKVFDPKIIEQSWYSRWLEAGLFHADADSKKPPFSIVIPPPNVTGVLHMGHALDNIPQDILSRYKRMKGFDVLWMPGTDHAGIATQNVIEKQLIAEGKNRHDLGREKFIERVWKWREESGGTIIRQLKRLGCSCDWERERFTMDEGLSKAVREVFVTLYEQGLMYRGNYLVNWCPRCETALSDIEVEHSDEHGYFWHIKYPLADGSGELIIATTRPETLLGDTAVAVHPEDERYKDLVGKKVILPLMEREIPIIADEYVDKEFGSGALKVTPAHDPNDYTLGKKHNLEEINILTPTGAINENGGEYAGMDRYEARDRIVHDLKHRKLLVKVEDHVHAVGQCYRCHSTVEPFLSEQWFVKMKPLADRALKAVADGKTRFVPANWTNTYNQWLENIRDWCVSRQIWWGHRIPAWYCDDCGAVMVLREDPSKCAKCGSKKIRQDEDVLDTWFSSQLWPFSTMGWPEKTKEVARYYPTSVLVTGFDIIFFWVARMMMAGLHFMDDVPFKDVYIHALVRDKNGNKMSKSRGNVVDPLTQIDQFGTDAFRFTFTVLAAQGRDILFDEKRAEGYRNFVNKLWNASRFVLLHEPEQGKMPVVDVKTLKVTDRWILSRLNKTVKTVGEAIEGYHFDRAGQAIYDFLWNEYCDWYIELTKPRLNGDDAEAKSAAVHTLITVLETILRLAHPIMPFVTEEIWQKLPVENRTEYLMQMPYPVADETLIDPELDASFADFQEVVKAIRNLRAEYNVPPGQDAAVTIVTKRNLFFESMKAQVELLAKACPLTVTNESVEIALSATAVVGTNEVIIPLEGLIDVTAEKKRLAEEIKKTEGFIAGTEKRLSNKAFTDKAPADVIEGAKKQLDELKQKRVLLKTSLARLG